MDHEFCPDCGHLLSRMATHCTFCGWSDRVDHFNDRGLDADLETAMMFGRVDSLCADQAILW